MSTLYKLYAPLGSEFPCPDTEMIPLKTTENHVISLILFSRRRICLQETFQDPIKGVFMT